MKRSFLLALCLLAISAVLANELLARGGRGGGGFSGGGRGGGGGGGARVGGGGGGGGRVGGGGGGGARYSGGSGNFGGHTPAMSRPSSSGGFQMPSGGRQSFGKLPTPGAGGGASRPNVGNVTRPNTGNVTRPNTGNITRPNTGGVRPGNIGNVGNPGNIAGNRPAVNRPGGGAPSRGDLDRFLDLPTTGGGMARPGGGMSRPSAGAIAGGVIAGGAAGQFLHDHPTTLPVGQPGTGDLAGIGRPGADGGIGGNIPGRPGQGGGGEQLRPGDNTRPITRPGQGGGGEQLKPGDRPGRPGDNDRPLRPGDNTRPGQGGGGEQLKPGDRPGRPGDNDRPGRPGDNDRPLRPGDNTRPGQGGSGEQWRPGDWANHRPDRIPDRDRWNNWRHDNHNNVWNNWNNNWNNNWHNCNHWWNNDWWDHHHWHYPYYPNFNYWGWAAWPGVTGWVDYGWQQPIYYNYGDNVYYDSGQVYYGDQPVASAVDYAQQAAAIALTPPAAAPAPEDWMPLGVFAVTTDGQPSGADPSMFLQLAVSKQGVLSGTWQNTSSDTAQEVEGMVDKETQRAAWVPKGKKAPIMETGVSNLTQETTPTLVHFADGTTQQWLLVRLDKPKEDGATPAK